MAILDFNTGIQMGLRGDTALIAGKGVVDAGQIGHYVKEGFIIDIENHRDEVAILQWTARNEVWISWYMYQPQRDIAPARRGSPVITLEGIDSNGELVQWGAMDGATDTGGRAARFYLYPEGVNNQSSTGYVQILADIDLMPTNAVRTRVDLHVLLDDVNGAVDVYINQSLVAGYVGDTILNPNLTTLTKSYFGMLGNYSNGAVEYDNDCTFSAAFAADEDTVPITMVQHEINANGAKQEMTGDYTDINTLGDWDDTTRLESDATNQTSIFDKTNVPTNFVTGYELISVGINTRSAVGDGQPTNNITHVINDGVNEVEGAVIAVDDLLQPRKTIFTTAADGGAWDATKLDATEVGVKSKA